jgi:hypothetical protein
MEFMRAGLPYPGTPAHRDGDTKSKSRMKDRNTGQLRCAYPRDHARIEFTIQPRRPLMEFVLGGLRRIDRA